MVVRVTVEVTNLREMIDMKVDFDNVISTLCQMATTNRTFQECEWAAYYQICRMVELTLKRHNDLFEKKFLPPDDDETVKGVVT